MNSFRTIRRFRYLAGIAVATALMIRALIPVGYMPGKLLDGELMVMCPVASSLTLELLRSHDLHPHHHGDAGTEATSIGLACPIGSSLFSDVLPAATPDGAPPRLPERYRTVANAGTHLAMPLRLYPARAPPHA